MLLFARKGWRSSVSRFNSSPVTIFPGRFQPGGKFIGSLVSGIRRRGSKYISHMKIEYFCKPAPRSSFMPVFWRIAASFQLLVVSLNCFLFSEAGVSFWSKFCNLFISSVVIVIISNIFCARRFLFHCMKTLLPSSDTNTLWKQQHTRKRGELVFSLAAIYHFTFSPKKSLQTKHNHNNIVVIDHHNWHKLFVDRWTRDDYCPL